MKSLAHIQVAIKELQEFFAACDHLKLDDKVIESQFKKLNSDQHCIDPDDRDQPLDEFGIMKNDLFQFEMLHRQFFD